MAVTTTILLGPEVPGSRKMTVASVLFDNSYASNGEEVSLTDLGLSRLDFLQVDAGSGYLARWDGNKTAPKIQLFRQTAATGALAEVPDGTDVKSVLVRVTAIGV
jgi:hypothetical protein